MWNNGDQKKQTPYYSSIMLKCMYRRCFDALHSRIYAFNFVYLVHEFYAIYM